MKTGGPDHPKIFAAASALGITRRDMVGLLELLWQWTARYAPQGDIGRYQNEAIAAAVDWTADANILISRLLACRWLDSDETHRILIHDWADHAPDYVRKSLRRKGLEIVRPMSGQCPATDRTIKPIPSVAKRSQVKSTEDGHGDETTAENSANGVALRSQQPLTDFDAKKQRAVKALRENTEESRVDSMALLVACGIQQRTALAMAGRYAPHIIRAKVGLAVRHAKSNLGGYVRRSLEKGSEKP